MFKNKHLLAAVLVAPVLAIVAYFAVDKLVGEQPHQAEAGQSYPLVALPNCRYSSGHCTLKNAGFKIDIKPEQIGAGVLVLTLEAAFPLQGARLALVDDPALAGEPESMQPLDDSRKLWRVALKGSPSADQQLRLVVAAGDAFYYGETALAFLKYETPYGADFRSQ